MSMILIVEDDLNINNMIREMLIKNNFECIQAFSGSEANLQIKQCDFDLIILDLMLPGMSGEDFINEVRKFKVTPIIVVSAKDDLDGKIDVLQSGADDYLTKPFELKELMARINVQLRRGQSVVKSDLINYKNLTLDKSIYKVMIENREINLTRQEFKILELLLTHPKKVFSKQEIYEYAWDDFYVGEDKTINVHISNIRIKLKKVTDEEYINTVWGIGFKLSE